MKQRIIALRYLLSALAVSAALSLVCFAQQASGSAVLPAVKPASADPAATLVADWTRARDYTKEYRSEEHTSELQSLTNLVCRLLLEKKKKTMTPIAHSAA